MSEFGVLFDLDGTLVNSLADICGAINEVRRRNRLPTLEFEAIRKFIGKGAQVLIEGCFPERPLSEMPSFVEQYRAVYLERVDWGGSLYPNVRQVLETLQKVPGMKLAIVTNKPSLVAEKTLAHYLPNFSFEAIMGPERVSACKPSPKHMWETLALIGLQPESCWFIGDDPVDAACARDSGVRFFGAMYGFGGVQVPPEQQLHEFGHLLGKLGLETSRIY